MVFLTVNINIIKIHLRAKIMTIACNKFKENEIDVIEITILSRLILF